MDTKEKYTQLLSDEDFQDAVRSFGNFSKEEQKAVLLKYAITEKEFGYAKKFLAGVSLRHEKLSQEEINYAVKRLMGQVTATSVPPKERKLGFMELLLRVAAVLSVPLLLSTFYFYQKSISQETVYYASTSGEQTTNTFQAPAGAKTQVVLPDGSLVWLNSGSSLSCPARFSADKREVKLKGEAYFEVVKDEQNPMLVSTGPLTVKVYGTKFNINAFADNGLVETTLVEGKVTLLLPLENKKEYVLEPGFTAFFNQGNRKVEAVKVEKMDAFTGWKDGKLLFHNQQFGDIVKRLERWYNVNIRLSDPTLGNYTLYATFVDENIEQVLEIFSNSIPISIDYPKRIKQADGTYSKREIVIKRDFNKKTN